MRWSCVQIIRKLVSILRPLTVVFQAVQLGYHILWVSVAPRVSFLFSLAVKPRNNGDQYERHFSQIILLLVASLLFHPFLREKMRNSRLLRVLCATRKISPTESYEIAKETIE